MILSYSKTYPTALKSPLQEKVATIKNVGNKILWKICFMFVFDMNTFSESQTLSVILWWVRQYFCYEVDCCDLLFWWHLGIFNENSEPRLCILDNVNLKKFQFTCTTSAEKCHFSVLVLAKIYIQDSKFSLRKLVEKIIELPIDCSI